MAKVKPGPTVNKQERAAGDDLARDPVDHRATDECRHDCEQCSDQRIADVSPRIPPAKDHPKRAIAENSLQHVWKQNADGGASHAESADEPKVRGERDDAGDN